MVERRGEGGFAQQPIERLGAVYEGVSEELERDIASEPWVTRAVYLAHATAADGREHEVMTHL